MKLFSTYYVPFTLSLFELRKDLLISVSGPDKTILLPSNRLYQWCTDLHQH